MVPCHDLDRYAAIRGYAVEPRAFAHTESSAVGTPVGTESEVPISQDLRLSPRSIDSLELKVLQIEEADLAAVRRPEGIHGPFRSWQRIRVQLVKRPDPEHDLALSILPDECDTSAVRRDAH